MWTKYHTVLSEVLSEVVKNPLFFWTDGKYIDSLQFRPAGHYLLWIEENVKERKSVPWRNTPPG